MKGSTEPFLGINEIKVNDNLDQEQALFPKRHELAAKISVQYVPNGALARDGSELALLMRACYARAAINHPEMREALKLGGFSDIDWNLFKENDEKFSQVLREALVTTPRPK
jgi:hypothetical protein